MMIGRRQALLDFRNSGSPSFAASRRPRGIHHAFASAKPSRSYCNYPPVVNSDNEGCGPFPGGFPEALWSFRESLPSLPRVHLPTSSSIRRVGNVLPGIDHPDSHVITTATAADSIRHDATQSPTRFVCARPGDDTANLTRHRPATAHSPSVRKLQEEKTEGKSI
jgi:hypothetical protein